MTELTVRVLGEADWTLYRTVRLTALKESPRSFTASLDEEAAQDEQWWRDRMKRSRRLLAERDQEPQGTISLGQYPDQPSSGEVFGLYVLPEVRGHGDLGVGELVEVGECPGAAAVAHVQGEGRLALADARHARRRVQGEGAG